MADIVLLTEDIPEEQVRAKRTLERHGFKVAVTDNLQGALRIWKSLGGDMKGIITDLHFPESADDDDASKPCGLAIVAEAARLGVPVVVCSSIDHHRADYLKMVVGTLALLHPIQRIPFVMDRKDWERAAYDLRDLIAAEREVS